MKRSITILLLLISVNALAQNVIQPGREMAILFPVRDNSNLVFSLIRYNNGDSTNADTLRIFNRQKPDREIYKIALKRGSVLSIYDDEQKLLSTIDSTLPFYSK